MSASSQSLRFRYIVVIVFSSILYILFSLRHICQMDFTILDHQILTIMRLSKLMDKKLFTILLSKVCYFDLWILVTILHSVRLDNLRQWFCCCLLLDIVAPIVCGGFVLLSTLGPFLFCNPLAGAESWLLCFYHLLDVIWLLLLLAPPHDAMCWPAVCDCGIS